MKIGELASAAGISTSRIRFYEEKGMIAPAARGGNGYRDYPSTTLEQLRAIMLGQSLGMSLATIKASAAPGGGMPNCDDARLILERRLTEIDSHIAQLTTMRVRITTMLDGFDQYHGDDPQVNELLLVQQ
jgi:MerR family copper efflux transcriptional regulator